MSGIDFFVRKNFHPNEPLKLGKLKMLIGSAQILKRHGSFRESNACEIKCFHFYHNPDIHKNKQ